MTDVSRRIASNLAREPHNYARVTPTAAFAGFANWSVLLVVIAYAGDRLIALLQGIPWPAAYISILVLYVVIRYFFVSQSAQVQALFGVFLDVGIRTGVPIPLMTTRLAQACGRRCRTRRVNQPLEPAVAMYEMAL